MNNQQALTIISLAMGLISSFCFAYSATFTSTKKIAAMARTYWNYNPEVLQAIVAQSAQYLVGTFYLFIYFLISYIASQSTLGDTPYPFLKYFSSFTLLLFSIVLFGALAIFLCNILSKINYKKAKDLISQKPNQ